MRGISRLTEELLVPEEGFCSMELIKHKRIQYLDYLNLYENLMLKCILKKIYECEDWVQLN